ncbi:MAG TPA: YhbY family RNA-binding protein [Casimicrobiaceae bacterium]|jgi:putative YhbY family RNA-binding protein
MPALDPAARRALRARAHHLDPVVSIGQHGLTAAVLHEIDVALKAHELIKVRVFGDDRDAREAIMQEVCAALDAAPVQHLGKLLVVFRENPEKRKPAARPDRKTKPEHATQRATEPLRGSKTMPRRRTQVARPSPPSGVPRAGLPRRRRARG